MLRRVIGEDIVLATSLQPQLGNVYADPGQIEQVLLNLAVNARDAMPQGGTLTISTAVDSHFVLGDKPAAPHVVLSVRDTGVGMAPDVQRRVFEPFFTTKAAGQGTGLGLSVVHGIVQQSGGHIDVDSTIGAGTTFRMFLPVIDQAPEEASVAREAVPRGSERILIVEDEGPLRSLISQGLREYGYTVLEAANGQEALALAARDQDRIRLLITDVVMPGMSGRIVAERFSALHPHARVLYLSGYTDDAVIRHGVLHEQVNFLQKPFSLDALTRKVSEVLSRNTAAS
jgi:CheY-like chemotaxis protein